MLAPLLAWLNIYSKYTTIGAMRLHGYRLFTRMRAKAIDVYRIQPEIRANNAYDAAWIKARSAAVEQRKEQVYKGLESFATTVKAQTEPETPLRMDAQTALGSATAFTSKDKDYE